MFMPRRFQKPSLYAARVGSSPRFDSQCRQTKWFSLYTAKASSSPRPYPQFWQTKWLFLLTILLGQLAVSVGHAATRTWTGTTSADWSNPANWTPAGVPGPA